MIKSPKISAQAFFSLKTTIFWLNPPFELLKIPPFSTLKPSFPKCHKCHDVLQRISFDDQRTSSPTRRTWGVSCRKNCIPTSAATCSDHIGHIWRCPLERRLHQNAGQVSGSWDDVQSSPRLEDFLHEEGPRCKSSKLGLEGHIETSG